MKKSILLASLVAAVALAACGKKEEAAVTAPAPAASEVASAPAVDASAPATPVSDAASAATEAASK
ncbi:hypothetical protein ACFJGW_13840 [Burkholderiaceae bacterium UC74_6]